MKTKYIFTVASALLFTASSYCQLVQWNFNGASATEVPGGTDSPSASYFGAGEFPVQALLVGGTTATFASGNTTAGTLESETTSPPNYAWNTTNYPAPGTENKARGVQFNINTAGRAEIRMQFEQRLSNKAGNTYVVQYTANRLDAVPVWVDMQTFTVTPDATTTGDAWYNERIVDFSAITAVDNNPNAAFRIVGAFDPVTGDYLATRSTSTYDGLGTVRFERVTFYNAVTMGKKDFKVNGDSFLISPNPASGGIIQFSESADVEIFNMAGQLILQLSGVNSMDASDLQKGLYMLRTSKGVQKLIIK